MITNQEHEADSSEDEAHESSNDRLLGVPVEYTRTLEKAYLFYKDGHVQKVKHHPMPKQNDHICITANVLPLMKKHRMYKVVIIICETTVKVSTAYCSCPAGLAGCCNHISPTLYTAWKTTLASGYMKMRKGVVLKGFRCGISLSPLMLNLILQKR